MNTVLKSVLSARTSIITGAAGHLGMKICETVAELGSAVAVVDHESKKPEQFAQVLRKKYKIKAEAFKINLENACLAKKLPKAIAMRLGEPEILINNAAYVGSSNLKGWNASFKNQTLISWNKAIAVNITAAFVLSQSSLPYLEKKSRGCIINICSIYGLLGPDWALYKNTSLGNPAAYSASKGALISFSRWLAATLAPKVRVNVISPGGIERNQPNKFKTRYKSKTPLKRMATEDDIKGAIAYLTSDAASYVTGQNIVIDGGFSII